MKNLQKFEKLFSRDFSLPSIEAWVKGESTNPKGWTDKKQPFLPYIIVENADDTIHFFYNMQGVDWVCDLLIKLSKQDRKFIPKIEQGVLEKLRFIRPIYENGQAIPLPELRKFIKAYQYGFPWFEAMWLYFEMDPARIQGLHLDSMKKLRTSTDKLCGGTDTIIRKSLAKIFPSLGFLSSYLHIYEIFNGKIPSKNELQKRAKGYFFVSDQLFPGATKAQITKKIGVQLVDDKAKKVKKIEGNIAQKGFAKGFVRRLMGHKQISLLKEGEILVSPMTIPDFLPAMKKAAAFVTDEGGILCHAAIVAREMRKPCIVGTKFATKVFKDGDFVEVDANKGIVTLLKE